MLLSMAVYILFFGMVVAAFFAKFGIVAICYISIMILYFCAEYFGLYGYAYVNKDLKNTVHEIISAFQFSRKGIEEVSKVYNYFYNCEV